LSFPALVIGSLSPDLGYCFPFLNPHGLSHRLFYGVWFCLPASLVLLGLYHQLRVPLVLALPKRFRELFLPVIVQPLGPFPVLLLSLLIGIASHLLWDGLTNRYGVFVVYFPVLREELFLIADHPIKVYHVLWYLFSFTGVAAVCLAYANWTRGPTNSCRVSINWVKWVQAMLVAGLVLPLGAVHHLFHDLLGTIVVAVLTVLLLAVAALRLGNSPSGSRN
jgi:hypothetical protein